MTHAQYAEFFSGQGILVLFFVFALAVAGALTSIDAEEKKIQRLMSGGLYGAAGAFGLLMFAFFSLAIYHNTIA